MREALLFLIIVCEILIALTRGVQVDEGSLSIMTTLIVVMFVAFTISAVLSKSKNMSMTRNYSVSGVIGFAVGLIYLAWVRSHLGGMLEWIKSYGLYILLSLILLSSVILYLKGPDKKKDKEPMPPAVPESKPEVEGPKDETQSV